MEKLKEKLLSFIFQILYRQNFYSQAA